jgi:hypothetical protein
VVLRNDQDLGHRWIRLKLVGTRSNRDAIGTWIRVRVGGQVLARQVMPTKSYLSQSELPITLGLGSGEPEDLVVVWPGGRQQRVSGVRSDQRVEIREP